MFRILRRTKKLPLVLFSTVPLNTQEEIKKIEEVPAKPLQFEVQPTPQVNKLKIWLINLLDLFLFVCHSCLVSYILNQKVDLVNTAFYSTLRFCALLNRTPKKKAETIGEYLVNDYGKILWYLNLGLTFSSKIDEKSNVNSQLPPTFSQENLYQFKYYLGNFILFDTLCILFTVHGGAWSIPDELETDHINGIKESLEKVYPKLKKGELTAMEAVVEVIQILEDNPTFDAGKGSFLNLKGEVEMDASIMDGKSLKCGAVACIQNVRHPIVVAQNVMLKTEHCLLVGKGALEFAKSVGIKECEPEELLTEREIEFLKAIKENRKFDSKSAFDPLYEKKTKMGTVGCVVIDKNGDIVAGTSTGGTPKKMPGRSGDSPIIGSGTYADNEFGGASATGWGESLMKIQFCGTAVRFMEFGMTKDSQESSDKIIDYLEKKVKGLGGIIMIDKNGNYGKSFNTKKMAYGFVENDEIIVKVEKNEKFKE